MSASLWPVRWHMQNMQISEFFNLLGHSSGSAGSWDVFRGRWHHTAISRILLLRMFSFDLGGVFFVRFFASLTIFGTCRISHFESHFSNFSSKCCNFRSPIAGRYIMTEDTQPSATTECKMANGLKIGHWRKTEIFTIIFVNIFFNALGEKTQDSNETL